MASFNFTYQPGTTIQQIIGFEMAGYIWGEALSDDVKINIHVGTTTDLPDNVLAGALPATFQANIRNFVDRLNADALSVDDQRMVLGLLRRGFADEFAAKFDFFINNRNIGAFEQSETMRLTRANGKALGLIGAEDTLDAFIAMRDLSNSAIQWSYNFARNTGSDPNSVDFLSVALHEIGHVLGFISSVDASGWLSSRPDVYAGEDITYLNSLVDRVSLATPLDFTRFSSDSQFLNDLSVGGDAYFSTDKESRLLGFATGKLTDEGGDGWQASHWQQANSHTLMKPALSLGQQAFIAREDLVAMDVIGWDMGINVNNLQLPSVLAQTKQGLANRLGVTLDWFEANSSAAATLLSQDMMGAVLTMANETYEGRTNSRTSSWQELMDVFAQEGLFDSFGMDLSQSPRQNRSRNVRMTVSGSDQGDELLGSRYHEQLVGKSGDDIIHGGSGHDNLRGGDGDDWLVGDRGVDVLYGGEGADTFVVQLANGTDIVKDFTASEDQLVLGTGLRWNDLDMVQKSNHVVISQETNPLMVLSDTDLNALR
jgi:hypothetical protein